MGDSTELGIRLSVDIILAVISALIILWAVRGLSRIYFVENINIVTWFKRKFIEKPITVRLIDDKYKSENAESDKYIMLRQLQSGNTYWYHIQTDGHIILVPWAAVEHYETGEYVMPKK